MIDGILTEAEKQKIKAKDDEELARTLPYLKRQLKALIARDIWDMSEYHQIMNEVSDIVQKGLEVISGEM
jgi:carboxyl-terminal processing protease